jgi:hypothetical protein
VDDDELQKLTLVWVLASIDLLDALAKILEEELSDKLDDV